MSGLTPGIVTTGDTARERAQAFLRQLENAEDRRKMAELMNTPLSDRTTPEGRHSPGRP
jgi:hypothetical protein